MYGRSRKLRPDLFGDQLEPAAPHHDRPSVPLPALRRRQAVFRLSQGGPACANCGLDLKFADSGDGPAIFVIFLVAPIVIALALLVGALFNPPPLCPPDPVDPDHAGAFLATVAPVQGVLVPCNTATMRMRGTSEPATRPPRHDLDLRVLMLALAATCLWLGTCRCSALAEKEALIAVVDARLGADPVPVPPAKQWSALDVEALNYQPSH